MARQFQHVLAGDVSFVGRSTEVEWLRELRAEAEAGEARVALIAGEPGIGKSRLVREFVAESDTLGWQTVWSRCSDDATVAPPFVAALVAQGKRAAIESAESLQAGDAARLASQLAARRPLLLVVDDLQASDPGTLGLFADFVRAVADGTREARNRLLVVVTHHEALDGDELSAHLTRLRREPLTRAARLAGMAEVEVNELVRRAAGGNCDPALLEALVVTTRGNPFYVLEVLNFLASHEQLREEDDVVSTVAPVSTLRLPGNAPASVAGRLGDLDGEAQEVLRQAALLGDPFQAVQLEAVVGAAAVVDPVDAAIGRGILVEQGDGFRFAHGIIRDSLLASMGPMRRRAAHAEIAAKLRARFGEQPAHILSIADHMLASAAPLEAAADGALLERAGDLALESYRWGRGRRYLEAALGCEPYRSILGAGDLGRLMCKVARGAAMAGDRATARERYFQAIAPLKEAREYDDWGRAILEWERTFSNLSEPIPDSGPYDEFVAAAGNNAAAVRLQLHTKWAEALWLARDPGDLEAAERAVREMPGVEDAYSRAWAIGTRALARMRHLDLEGALADFTASEREAAPTNHPPFLGLGASRRAWPLLMMNRVSEAAAAAETARAIAAGGNDWAHLSLNLATLHITAQLQGDGQAAERLRSEATMMLTRARFPQAAFFLNGSVARDRWLRGDFEAALGAAQAWGLSAGRTAARPLVSTLRVLAGEGDAVRRELADTPLRAARGGVDFNVLGAYCAQVELAVALTDPELAERTYEVLSGVASNGVRFCASPPFLLDRLLAAGALVLERFNACQEHLDAAEGAATAAGAGPELGLVHLERARLLVKTSASTERTEASLAAAAAIFERLGLGWPASQARDVALSAGIDPARSPVLSADPKLTALDRELLAEFAAGAASAAIADRLLLMPRTVEDRLARLRERLRLASPADARKLVAPEPRSRSADAAPHPALRDLTARELDVLRLIARGRTNQQIADDLVVSIHTAQSHVKNILGKTQAANRTEAARLAAEAGLV